jgi:hypothetical protein
VGKAGCGRRLGTCEGEFCLVMGRIFFISVLMSMAYDT